MLLHLPLKVVLLGLLAVPALTACDGAGSGGDPAELAALPPPPPPMPQAPAIAWSGRYVGSVTIDGVDYYGDAIFTDDGVARVYVGGVYNADGALPENPPEASMQFVGSILQRSKDQVSGGGHIFGQQCASPGASPFCHMTGVANLSIAVGSSNIQGQIAVTTVTSPGDDIWTLKMSPFSNYYLDLPASRVSLEGQYQEVLADFSVDGDTIVSIDAQGALSFQSPHSGCTGRGRVKPHSSGAFDVYGVSLTITDCTGPYAYMNTTFVGLATTSPSSQWNYDTLLLIWLSQQSPQVWDDPSIPALTMLGVPQ